MRKRVWLQEGQRIAKRGSVYERVCKLRRKRCVFVRRMRGVHVQRYIWRGTWRVSSRCI